MSTNQPTNSLGVRRGIAVASALVLSLTSLALATPATADDAEPIVITVPLVFGGYDAARALEYGYDVRTTDAGWDYAVPVGTPEGSMEGATALYNPETGEVQGFEAGRGTVAGPCGTSTLTLYSATSGYTAYNLDGAVGGSIYHEWGVSVQSQYGAQVVDRSGLPPYPGALNWGTNFSFNVGAAGHGSTYISGVASGVVSTTFGTCYGLGAPDAIYT